MLTSDEDVIYAANKHLNYRLLPSAMKVIPLIKIKVQIPTKECILIFRDDFHAQLIRDWKKLKAIGAMLYEVVSYDILGSIFFLISDQFCC